MKQRGVFLIGLILIIFYYFLFPRSSGRELIFRPESLSSVEQTLSVRSPDAVTAADNGYGVSFLNSDYSKASQAYERGLKVAPRDKSLLFNYAVTREAQQDLEGAKELFLEILSIDPNDRSAQEHLDRITDF